MGGGSKRGNLGWGVGGGGGTDYAGLHFPQASGPEPLRAAIPSKTLLRQRPLTGQDFESPQQGAPAIGGYHPPASAPYAVTTDGAKLPIPPTRGPTPLEAVILRRHSIGSDHRLSRTPDPPSQRVCTVGDCHLPQAVLEERPPTRQASPSPEQMGLSRWGLPSPVGAL